MPTNTAPPTDGRAEPTPDDHQGATPDVPVFDEENPQVEKRKKDEANAEEVLAAIKNIQNPFPQLTDMQRYAIRQYSPFLGQEALAEVEKCLCLGLALHASSTARGKASPSGRQLAELARKARAILPDLDRVDARTQLRILSVVCEADLSGVTRAEWWRILVGLLTAVVVGASDLAAETEAKAGAPPLPDYILSTVKMLGAIWKKYGQATRQTNRQYPDQKLANSDLEGSFEQWVQDLLVKALNFATTSQVHTAVRKVVDEANREREQQAEDGGA